MNGNSRKGTADCPVFQSLGGRRPWDTNKFMGKCVNHPERETSYLCMKHNAYVCESCLACRDPELYCKFRPSCPIWFIHKERRREARQQAEREAGNSAGEMT